MVRAILIGAGQFGTSLLAQAARLPDLEVSVVCDREIRALAGALEQDGLVPGAAYCTGRSEALGTLRAGGTVLADQPELALELPADILVEATGQPVAAAAHAARAIQNGLHVAMVSKESDVTVGPVLAARAATADVIYTPVDGDQPSLLIGLIDRLRGLGLEVVAAGKSSEYDLVFTPSEGRLRIRDDAYPAVGLEGCFHMAGEPAATLRQRDEVLADVPRRGAPDFCEMGIVVNATGLAVDRPDLHAPILRPVDLAEVFRPEADGGVLGRAGVVDIFHALRRDDEASFAGGVFVVVRCHHRPTWELLREKGHVVSRDGRHAAIYQPSHLLGVEAVGSILRAVRERRPTPGYTPRPVIDLAGRAARALAAGHPLGLAERHEIGGLEPLLVPAGPVSADRPLPFYLAAGGQLAEPLEAGAIVTAGRVAPAPDDPLRTLRAEQDRTFFS